MISGENPTSSSDGELNVHGMPSVINKKRIWRMDSVAVRCFELIERVPKYDIIRRIMEILKYDCFSVKFF